MNYLVQCLKTFITLCIPVFLTGCHVPVIYAIHACQCLCEHTNNVGNDPDQGCLAGKEYVLNENVILYKKDRTCISYLDNNIKNRHFVNDEGNVRCVLENPEIIPYFEVIKKGTKIKVTHVYLETSYDRVGKHYVYVEVRNNTGEYLITDATEIFPQTHTCDQNNLIHHDMSLLSPI